MTTLAAAILTHHEVTVFLLSLAVLLGLAKLLGEIARMLGQPSVVGEILAGVLLGQTVLGSLAPGAYAFLFPADTAVSSVPIGLETLVVLSAILLLLVAGLEVDLSSVARQGKAMLLVSSMGVVIPFGLGFGFAYLFPGLLGQASSELHLAFALFMGIALSITALPVIAKILIDLNLAKSDLGMLILSSAMVNDLLGWIGFAMVLAMMPVASGGDVAGASGGVSGGASGVWVTILITVGFVALMLTVVRWAAHRVLPYIQAHMSWPGGVLVFVMVLAILCSALTEWIGVHSIFGAFLAGVAIGDSRHLRENTRKTIHDFITHVFAPLFFASIGLRVNFIEAFDLQMVILVLVIAVTGKAIGCYLGAKWSGLTQRESWAVGFGMVARGAMEIILAQLALGAGLIDHRSFVAIVVMAILTSLIAGPAIEKLLKRKTQRTLADAINEKLFIADMKAHNAREAIGELAALASPVVGVPSKLITDAVWQRELAMRTGIGNGIAVPHARMPEIKKACLVVGRTERGIDFDASDGQAARIICMILTPQGDQTSQIEMLQIVARAFTQPRARADAFDANTYVEFRAALRVSQVDTDHTHQA